MDRRKNAIEEADRAYRRIFEIRPAAPPVWAVAAAARVGQMWDAFAVEFQGAPTPGWMRADDELRQQYATNLAQAVQPFVQRARVAFELCRDEAQRYGLAGENVRACSSWLAGHPAAP